MRIPATIILLFLLPCFGSGQVAVKKFDLPPGLSEVSGMFYNKGFFGLHGDGGSAPAIYRLTMDGKIHDTTTLSQANTDWEDMGINSRFVVLGDFGNNQGTRKDLALILIPADSLGKKQVNAGVVKFSYPDQVDFSSNTFSDYDCEAIIVLEDSALLFSKSKSTAICRIYSLPLIPGVHQARLLDTLKLPFWVCGAGHQSGRLVLTGYAPNWDLSLTPWIYLADMKNGLPDRNSGRYSALNVSGSTQTESVCFGDSGSVWITSEAYRGAPAALYHLDTRFAAIDEVLETSTLFPNPASREIHVSAGEAGLSYTVYDAQGRMVLRGRTMDGGRVSIGGLKPGTYSIEVKKGCRRMKESFIKH